MREIKMKMNFLKILAASGLLSISQVDMAVAHHSFAMFDFGKVVTLKGTVKDFQWTNPHVVLYVYAESQDGQQPELWALELTSPGNLTRAGWNRHVFKTGDRVEIDVNPLRDGKHGGAFNKGTVVGSGQVWTGNYKQTEKPNLQ